jgi:hypothetical protein
MNKLWKGDNCEREKKLIAFPYKVVALADPEIKRNAEEPGTGYHKIYRCKTKDKHSFNIKCSRKVQVHSYKNKRNDTTHKLSYLLH